MKKNPKHGDLRVWWIPQIPGRPFLVPVESLSEAKKLLAVLADYDLFQLNHRIKPDYSNAGGLSVFDSRDDQDSLQGSWVDWSTEDGLSIDEIELEAIPK